MSAASGGEPGREGLYSALNKLLATLMAIGTTRAELLVSEVEEEKLRLMSLWAKAFSVAWLFAIGIVMAVCCVALLYWEQRVLVFGIAAAAFLVVGFVVFVSLRRQLAQPSKMFNASLAELETDMAQLRRREKKQ